MGIDLRISALVSSKRFSSFSNTDECLACRTTCHDQPTGESGGSCPAVRFSPLERFRAQTGSILVRRGGRAAAFFQDWATRYVEMWRGKRRCLRNNSVGTDQAPCDSLLARSCGAKRARPWTLGWLPANWNLRPTYSHAEPLWGPVRLLHDDGIGHHKSPRDRIALGRAACDRVNAAGNGSGWRVVVSSGSRHGAAVLRETNALDEVVRPFATSVEVAAAALVARVKRSN